MNNLQSSNVENSDTEKNFDSEQYNKNCIILNYLTDPRFSNNKKITLDPNCYMFNNKSKEFYILSPDVYLDFQNDKNLEGWTIQSEGRCYIKNIPSNMIFRNLNNHSFLTDIGDYCEIHGVGEGVKLVNIGKNCNITNICETASLYNMKEDTTLKNISKKATLINCADSCIIKYEINKSEIVKNAKLESLKEFRVTILIYVLGAILSSILNYFFRQEKILSLNVFLILIYILPLIILLVDRQIRIYLIKKQIN